MLSFRSFEIVDAIFRGGSLSRAAELLDMTQPALTKALSGLEGELGAKLFERRATGMEPTAFAGVMLRRWDRLHCDLTEMRHEIDRMRDLDGGRLRIATGFLAASSVEAAIGNMAQKFPSLRLSLQQLGWSEIANAVRRADVDIGVADLEAAKDDPSFDVELLNERQAYFVCRTGHPLGEMKAPKLDDILAYPLVLNLVPARWADYFPDAIESFGFERLEAGHLRPPIFIQSLSAIKAILLRSDAISTLPSDILEHDAATGLTMRLENFAAPWFKFKIGCVTRKQSIRTPAMAAFIDEVRQIEISRMQTDDELGRTPTADATEGSILG